MRTINNINIPELFKPLESKSAIPNPHNDEAKDTAKKKKNFSAVSSNPERKYNGTINKDTKRS